ncbi:hypothetical protein [Aeromicrobium sp. IC_218]|uniref:hypothetical protein n=1 Tax=Aeromicrobium sp. IC_218 TaxID=2545468 RepID=UPI00103C9237|nr:hypothetical protein [Aeromicrobium sp. IC_218]TCI99830.1 hypothetical protein E0W78_05340 [Aeromicrobium sp. IC_218]
MTDDATNPDPTTADEIPAEPAATRRVRKPLAIGLAVAAIGAIAAGGVYAASRLTGSDASEMAALVPSEAIGFAAVNLDPSASQKLAMDDLLKKLEREGGEDRVVDADVLSVDALLEELTCDDVSLADGDWAGDRAAIVALPAEKKTDEPFSVAVYAAVDDERTAKELARKIGEDGMDCGDDTTVSATYLDQDGGWLVATDGALPALPDSDGFESLADSADFREDVEALGDEGVATAWADMEAAGALAEEMGVDATGADGRVAATVRASDDSLELFASVPVAEDAPEPKTSVADVLEKLPADAVGVLASPGGTPAAADLAEAEEMGLSSFVQLLSEPLGVAFDRDGAFTGAVKADQEDVEAGVAEVASIVSLFTSGFGMGYAVEDEQVTLDGEYSDPELDAEFERCLESATSVDDFEKCTPPDSAYATDDMIAEDLGDLTAPEAFQPETADAGDGFVRFATPGASTDVDEPLTGSRLLQHVEGDLDDLSMLGVVDVRALLGDDAEHVGELGAIDHALLTGERDGDREQLRLRVVLR